MGPLNSFLCCRLLWSFSSGYSVSVSCFSSSLRRVLHYWDETDLAFPLHLLAISYAARLTQRCLAPFYRHWGVFILHGSVITGLDTHGLVSDVKIKSWKSMFTRPLNPVKFGQNEKSSLSSLFLKPLTKATHWLTELSVYYLVIVL